LLGKGALIMLIFKDDLTITHPALVIAYETLRKAQHMNEDIFCYVDLNDHRRRARVERMNTKTVWVSIVFGANTRKTIKRHIRKHNVRFTDASLHI
jgi:hypothetical protein